MYELIGKYKLQLEKVYDDTHDKTYIFTMVSAYILIVYNTN